MKIDLHNFFRYYDENNPKHVAAVEQLEVDMEDSPLMEDTSNWVRIFRSQPEKPKSSILDVPFFPQTDNYRDANRTCNSSACAMVLEYLRPGTLKGAKGDDAYVQKVIGILHRGSLSAPTGGHMVVVIGKTPSGDYVVNDPYGSLNDGYTGSVFNGKGAVYKKSDLSRRWVPNGNDGWGRIFDVKK